MGWTLKKAIMISAAMILGWLIAFFVSRLLIGLLEPDEIHSAWVFSIPLLLVRVVAFLVDPLNAIMFVIFSGIAYSGLRRFFGP
jgi:hypothetical protein